MNDNTLLISDGTQRNWSRLSFNHYNKLTSRANKSKSQKLITPDKYIDGIHLSEILYNIKHSTYNCRDIFTYLCQQKLSHIGDKINIKKFLSEYKLSADINLNIPEDIILDTQLDWLGYLYQAYTPEGKRNLQGMYYTNEDIVQKMLCDIDTENGYSFLDPCCGTGSFLMNVNAKSLSQLYGIDSDCIAVMIAKANLIALYPNDDTYPQIYCEDFLGNDIFYQSKIQGVLFDYIYTNPPWGVSRGNSYTSTIIKSKERSSLFFTKAFMLLKPLGKMSFLLPSALLKVKIHQDFRSFVLNETKIDKISIYKERFNGVYTDFFSISVTKQGNNGSQSYCVSKDGESINVVIPISARQTEIEINSSKENDILTKIEALGCYKLKDSIWALGVVTGDNKNKIKSCKLSEDYEAIYTGKNIDKYALTSPTNYIKYDRTQLQQCAKDAIYRSPEKLVYKFISKTLCFAYDNSSSLFLNSANILIPNIEGMSIKTVMAFLNSDIFAYYYKKKHSDIKILKSNLMALQFPRVTPLQDEEITQLVNSVLNGNTKAIESINEYIFCIYDFTTNMKTEIKKELYGNTIIRT